MRGLSKICAAILSVLVLSAPAYPADHGDAPNPGYDRASDIADVYFFLDPNDNGRVIVLFTITGFIVPGENVNFGLFDPNIRYSLRFENTGDARPDRFIDIFFSPRSSSTPQTATVRLPGGGTFQAPATLGSNTADTPPAPIITTDSASGIIFFAGQTDDPFFFDIPGFGRFSASVSAGSPDPSVLGRGRDSFAGYNILSIAMSVPVGLLRGSSGNIIGVNAATERRQHQSILPGGEIVGRGRWVQVDRMAIPTINVALIPFDRKNAYNAADMIDDSNLEFADDITTTLRRFGSSEATINTLANAAILRGDYLRLDTSIANTGTGGGNNPTAGFPNGRRLQDDVIDTILTIVANGAPLGDSVDANDLPFNDVFPFLAPAHQPRTPGTIDDLTRN